MKRALSMVLSLVLSMSICSQSMTTYAYEDTNTTSEVQETSVEDSNKSKEEDSIDEVQETSVEDSNESKEEDSTDEVQETNENQVEERLSRQSELSNASTYAVSMSSDLNNFVESVIINKNDALNGEVTLKPDTNYNLGITFRENGTMQFNHDANNLVYSFPSNIVVPDSNGIINLNLTDINNQPYVVQANYVIKDNKLSITFDKDNANYQKLVNTSNVYMRLNFKFKLSEDAKDGTIDWSADKHTTIKVDNTQNVTVEKNGVYDKENGVFKYTLTVKSTGNNENVTVTDALKGTAITLNEDVTVESSKKDKVDGTYTKTNNGFTYKIPSMGDGEKITFKYSASIDYSKLSSAGKFTVDETNNEVSVKSDKTPENKDDKNFSNETKYDFISKDGKLSDDNKTITWTITVNADAKVSVGNSVITDELTKNDKVPMEYNGNGISVQRYDSKGNKVDSAFDVKWQDLMLFNKTSNWKYQLPNDKKAYKYVITYTTSVDNSLIFDDTNVKNTVEDDKNHKADKSISILPGNVFDVKKTNKGLNKDGTVDYTVSVTIPKTGFNKFFEINDVLPKEKLTQYKDTFVDDSLRVELDGKELSGDNYELESEKNNDSKNDQITLTFNNVAKLFPKSDKDRVLKVTYKIKANTDWAGKHSNKVKVEADGVKDSDTSDFILAKESITKTADTKDKVNSLQTYRYYIRLEGVSSDDVVVNDEFDKTLLELFEDNTKNKILVGASDTDKEANSKADYRSKDSGNGGQITKVSTDKGLKFSFKPNKKADGTYYRFYTIGYTLKIKDKEALDKIQQGAIKSNGIFKLSNKAIWGAHETNMDVDYKVSPVKKSLTIKPSEKNNYLATFEIDINPEGLELNNGQDLTVTDLMSSTMRYVGGSTKVNDEAIEPVVSENGTKLVWKVKDKKHIKIEYQARIVGTGKVVYSNQANITGGFKSESKDNNVTIKSSGQGGGSMIAINILKRDGQDNSILLGGAQFQLFEKNKTGEFEAVKNNKGKNVIFTTSSNTSDLGKAKIFGSLTKDGWTLSEGYTYMLKEVKAPEGYQTGKDVVFTIKDTATKEDEYVSQDTIYIDNTKIEKTSVSGTKTWNDANDQDGKRPESITVNLLADGTKIDSKVVTSSDDWKYSFDNLDKYKDGKEIKYTITEDVVEGYTTKVDGFNLTNTHEVEKTKVSGTKTWNDSNDQDGKRPESVTVNLLADGTKVDSKVVKSSDNWKYTFDNLDKYKDGQKIVYTITEDVVEGYTTKVDGFNLTNTHEVEKTKVSGTKTWNDSNDQDGKRPGSITVNLLADGVKVDSKVVTSSDDWKYSFDNLDKYKNGQKIVYTIAEDEVPNYSTSISGYDVTNTYTPGKTSVSVTKSWNDNNDVDKLRPDSVNIHLCANGKDTGISAELNESNHWSYIFGGLDVYKNGKKIIYTVVEDSVKGYVSSVSGNSEVGFVFTNTHTPKDSENPDTGVNTGVKFYAGLSSIALGSLYVLLKKKRR